MITICNKALYNKHTSHILTSLFNEHALINKSSLSMLVLNSRDRHEKLATEFYAPQNTPYKNVYLRKAD